MCKRKHHTGASSLGKGVASVSSQETAQTAVQGREYQGVSIPPVGTYELDPTHTVVGFVARHMLSKVRGRLPVSPEPSRSGTRPRTRTSAAGERPGATRTTPRNENRT